jgi:F0F1-type ATP synthase assembly protein I
MKKRIANSIAGIIVYAPLGWLTTLFSDMDISAKVQYIIFFTIGMSLADVFILQPLRKRLEAKNAKKGKA